MYKIMFSAGETSGDMHGSVVVSMFVSNLRITAMPRRGRQMPGPGAAPRRKKENRLCGTHTVPSEQTLFWSYSTGRVRFWQVKDQAFACAMQSATASCTALTEKLRVEEVMASTLVSPWLSTTAAAMLLRRSSFIRSSLPEEVILQSVMASSLKVMVTVTVL